MPPTGLLQPLLIPIQIWEEVAMVFITRLPNSFGFTVIMVVDHLSKYGHFVALKTNYNSRIVVEVFMKNIVKLHGMFKSIVLDRDKVFISHFLTTFIQITGHFFGDVFRLPSKN